MSIEHTSRTGADKGYYMVVPENACSTMNADWHNASINYALQNVSTVTDVDSVIGALWARIARRIREAGMTTGTLGQHVRRSAPAAQSALRSATGPDPWCAAVLAWIIFFASGTSADPLATDPDRLRHGPPSMLMTIGGLYFVVAAGFTLIFGLMRVVNLAHGSLFLLGGFVALEFQKALGWQGRQLLTRRRRPNGVVGASCASCPGRRSRRASSSSRSSSAGSRVRT